MPGLSQIQIPVAEELKIFEEKFKITILYGAFVIKDDEKN